MSSIEKFKSIESVRLEAELMLADYLFENDIISESVYKVDYMGSGSQMLIENASRMNSPGYMYRNIHYTDFKNIWNNVRDYPDTEAVYRALHPENQNFSKSTPGTWVKRALDKFLGSGKSSDPGVPEARSELIATSSQGRAEIEKKYRAGKVEDLADDLDDLTYSIDGGYTRKSSRSGNIERASTLFPGDLYSDRTQIPPRRWGSWWKRFLRRQTSVADPESGIMSLRKWTKHFIMGYQISPSLFFEIWYNSMDSTFSVHDKYGNIVRQGENIPLMRDALNVLFHNVADASPKDAEVLNMRSPDLRKVNQDIARALNGEVDAARGQAERMRDRKDKIAELQNKEAEQRRKRQEAEMRNAANMRGSSERDEEEKTDAGIRDQVKKAASAGKKAYKTVDKFMGKLAEIKRRQDEQLKKAEEEFNNRASGGEVNDEGGAAAARREQRQQDAMRKMEEEKLKAETELKNFEQELESELQAMKQSRVTVGEDDTDRQEEIKKAESELEQIRKELDDVEKEYDQKWVQNAKKLAAGKTRKKKTKPYAPKADEEDEPSLADYTRSKDGNNKKAVNEATAFDDFMQGAGQDDETGGDDATIDLSDYEENPLYRVKANQEVDVVRKKAESSSYTRQLINNMFLEGFVQMYDQTRVRDNRSFVRRIFDRLKIFRGRVEPIALPTRVVSTYMRAKGFFGGAQARADFIIGYTINDVANFEIWYVQEISNDGTKQYASFYLYDVTAMKILERNIPHYRNAIQLLILKIGSEDTKGA